MLSCLQAPGQHLELLLLQALPPGHALQVWRVQLLLHLAPTACRPAAAGAALAAGAAHPVGQRVHCQPHCLWTLRQLLPLAVAACCVQNLHRQRRCQMSPCCPASAQGTPRSDDATQGDRQGAGRGSGVQQEARDSRAQSVRGCTDGLDLTDVSKTLLIPGATTCSWGVLAAAALGCASKAYTSCGC